MRTTVVRTPRGVSSIVIPRARLSTLAASAEKRDDPGSGAYPEKEERRMIRFWDGVAVRSGMNARAMVIGVVRLWEIVSCERGSVMRGEGK